MKDAIIATSGLMVLWADEVYTQSTSIDFLEINKGV